jgi:hypothetical protein
MSVRLAMEVGLLDLKGVTWDRIEDFEEDQAEPSVEELAAIMAVLAVPLAQVDGLLPWPPEDLEATLASYVGRVAEARGTGHGQSEARRSRGEANGVEP